MAEIAACRVSGATLRRRMRSVEGSGLYTIEVICTRLLQETGPPAMSGMTQSGHRIPLLRVNLHASTKGFDTFSSGNK